jgi:hypothetical protein
MDGRSTVSPFYASPSCRLAFLGAAPTHPRAAGSAENQGSRQGSNEVYPAALERHEIATGIKKDCPLATRVARGTPR